MIEVWSARAEPARGCGIALVRVLLAGRLGVPASEVPIRRFCARCGASDHGKPYLDGTTLRATGHEPPAPLHFSVSHAGGRVLVALGPVPVGVDLARVADVTPDAAGAWLAAAMPHARHVVIPGAAHAPFLSHRAAFDVAVTEFLDAV